MPNAHTICISAWDLSSDIDTALEAAARNGANVTVITPWGENSGNIAGLRAIIAAGGHAVYEFSTTSTTPPTPNPSYTPLLDPTQYTYQHASFDIHAKFALIDGVAYMDGHNWFTTDVVMRDGYAQDYSAIYADLTSFPSPPPSGSSTTVFTTDKQISLKSESDYLQNVAIPALNTGAADEYDFITESYNPNSASDSKSPYGYDFNDNVYIGMCQIASITPHPTIHMVFESESGYSTAAQTSLANLLLIDPSADIRSNNNGHEKISMIRHAGTPVSAWFGSSNATTTEYFDWGMVITDPTMLTSLKTYFDNVELANSAAITPVSTTQAACGTVHS